MSAVSDDSALGVPLQEAQESPLRVWTEPEESTGPEEFWLTDGSRLYRLRTWSMKQWERIPIDKRPKGALVSESGGRRAVFEKMVD